MTSVHTALLQLQSAVAAANFESASEELRRALAEKFDAEQPRAPAGQPDGGRWTSGDGDGSGGSNHPDLPVSTAAAMSSRAECEAQWKRDIFHCNMVGVPACYQQALRRLVACERDQPIPPLNY